MFVDDETEVDFRLLYLSEHVLQASRVYEKKRWLEHFFKSKLLGPQDIGHYILAVNKTNYIIERITINRQSRIAMLAKGFSYLLKRAIIWDRGHGGARDHSLAH